MKSLLHGSPRSIDCLPPSCPCLTAVIGLDVTVSVTVSKAPPPCSARGPVAAYAAHASGNALGTCPHSSGIPTKRGPFRLLHTLHFPPSTPGCLSCLYPDLFAGSSPSTWSFTCLNSHHQVNFLSKANHKHVLDSLTKYIERRKICERILGRPLRARDNLMKYCCHGGAMPASIARQMLSLPAIRDQAVRPPSSAPIHWGAQINRPVYVFSCQLPSSWPKFLLRPISHHIQNLSPGRCPLPNVILPPVPGSPASSPLHCPPSFVHPLRPHVSQSWNPRPAFFRLVLERVLSTPGVSSLQLEALHLQPSATFAFTFNRPSGTIRLQLTKRLFLVPGRTPRTTIPTSTVRRLGGAPPRPRLDDQPRPPPTPSPCPYDPASQSCDWGRRLGPQARVTWRRKASPLTGEKGRAP